MKGAFVIQESKPITVQKIFSPDWKAVGKIIGSHSATFYLGSLLFPLLQRRGVWAVYAACRTGDDAVDESPNPKEELENWWAAIERSFAGNPQHDWERSLTWAAAKWDIPRKAFEDMLEGFKTDLQPVRFSTTAQLLDYCYQVAGTVGLMIAPITGSLKSAEVCAVKLGQAMQLTNILRDVGEDLEMGRMYLPDDLLQKFNLNRENLFAAVGTPAYSAAMKHLSDMAMELYQEGIEAIPELKVGRAAVRYAALQYRWILFKLEAKGWDNFSSRTSLNALERIRLVPKAIFSS